MLVQQNMDSKWGLLMKLDAAEAERQQQQTVLNRASDMAAQEALRKAQLKESAARRRQEQGELRKEAEATNSAVQAYEAEERRRVEAARAKFQSLKADQQAQVRLPRGYGNADMTAHCVLI